MERVHLRIAGRVQGVWYRASTVQEGLRLGLTGTARNLPDGTVAVRAEGPRDALEELVAWCRRGPRLAKVTSVEATWTAARGEFEGFVVVR